MIDRRKHDRFVPVAEYKLTLRIHDVEFQIRPDNMSRGGAFLRPGVFFPLGAKLEVELGWHSGPAKMPARVVRRETDGVAIEFAKPYYEPDNKLSVRYRARVI